MRLVDLELKRRLGEAVVENPEDRAGLAAIAKTSMRLHTDMAVLRG